MQPSRFVVAALLAISLGSATRAEQIPVKHIQLPMHGFMLARSDAGKIIARAEFTQSVQGDEVSMRLTYHFADGSTDDETTTYRQQGTFRLVRDRHIQKGPYFTKPVDFEVDAATSAAITRRTQENGAVHIESEHVDLPDDVANGFVGTLLLNVSPDKAPFRVGLLVPLGGGRLIRLLISREGERSFQFAEQSRQAIVFCIHPELGGFVGWIASLLGLQPKDVTVWVMEGEQPAVVRIVGQLGGYGPVVSSELEGISFEK